MSLVNNQYSYLDIDLKNKKRNRKIEFKTINVFIDHTPYTYIQNNDESSQKECVYR